MQASLTTLGPVYVGGAAAFEVKVQLKPGESRMNCWVKCPDTAKAVPIAASLLEDDSGWLTPFPPKVRVKGSDGLPEVSNSELSSGGIKTLFGGNIKNFHATKDITVTVNAAVKALEAGSHTCQITFGGSPSNSVDITFEAVESPATPPTNVSASRYSYFLDLHLCCAGSLYCKTSAADS